MLKIPKTQRTTFKRHLVARAFFEVRFSPVVVDWENKKNQFKQSLSKNKIAFSSIENSIESKFEVKLAENIASFSTRPDGVVVKDGEHTFTFRSDRVLLESQKYISFDEFLKKMRAFGKSFEAVVGDLNVSWLGIRKINRVTVKTSQGDYQGEGINRSLFQLASQGTIESGCLRQAETSYVMAKDGMQCRIAAKTTKGQSIPALGSMPTYQVLFDIDVNKKLNTSTKFDDIEKEAEDINNYLFDVFCWMADEKVIEALGK